MMVGMPTIISAPDAHPERKFQRRDGGMQSFCAKMNFCVGISAPDAHPERK